MPVEGVQDILSILPAPPPPPPRGAQPEGIWYGSVSGVLLSTSVHFVRSCVGTVFQTRELVGALQQSLNLAPGNRKLAMWPFLHLYLLPAIRHVGPNETEE